MTLPLEIKSEAKTSLFLKRFFKTLLLICPITYKKPSQVFRNMFLPSKEVKVSFINHIQTLFEQILLTITLTYYHAAILSNIRLYSVATNRKLLAVWFHIPEGTWTHTHSQKKKTQNCWVFKYSKAVRKGRLACRKDVQGTWLQSWPVYFSFPIMIYLVYYQC